jgi:hypothetical protein
MFITSAIFHHPTISMIWNMMGMGVLFEIQVLA